MPGTPFQTVCYRAADKQRQEGRKCQWAGDHHITHEEGERRWTGESQYHNDNYQCGEDRDHEQNQLYLPVSSPHRTKPVTSPHNRLTQHTSAALHSYRRRKGSPQRLQRCVFYTVFDCIQDILYSFLITILQQDSLNTRLAIICCF